MQTIRLFLRTFGLLLLSGGFGALVYDGVRMFANAAFSPAPARMLWQTLSAGSFESARNWADASIPFAWNVIVSPLLMLPAWVLLTAAGTLIFLAGYRPKPPEIIPDF
jgi:hypothetical protein